MKLNVAVFFGGKSTEHEISCISASQAIKALDNEKYNIIPVYIAKNNDFYTGDELFSIEGISAYSSLDELTNKLEKVSFYKDGNKVYMSPIKKSFLGKKDVLIDVAFPVVHGSNIEDGSLAGYLEMLDLPYTSSNVLGSAIGQDKIIMKDILQAEGVDIVPWFYLYEEDLNDLDLIKEKAKKITYPLICKPANLGSSIGIEFVYNEDELKEKLQECFKYDFKVVVEKMIEDLREVNISLMTLDGEIVCSVIEEVTNGFLNFDKKYQPGGNKGSKKLGLKSSSASKGMASTIRKVPADLDLDIEEKVKELAIKSYKALNAYGVVRIDFIIDNKENKVYMNEINTIPGSLAFYLWNKQDVDFSKECDLLINNAIKRYSQKEKKTYSFETNILNNYRRN